MHPLDLGGDAKGYGVTAANRAEAEKVEVAASEVVSGETAKISFIAIGILQPTVVDAIQVHHVRLQAFSLKHGGKAQYADRRKLAHDAGRFRFAYDAAIEL